MIRCIGAGLRLASTGFPSFARAVPAAFLLVLVAIPISPSSAKPSVEYVQICNVYGAHDFYIPGTDKCFKSVGHNLYEVRPVPGTAVLPMPWQERACEALGAGSHWYPRGSGMQCIMLDMRSSTAHGTLQTYARLSAAPGDLPQPQTSFLAGGLPSGLDFEAGIFGGPVWASSFNNNYSTGLFGGRGAIGFVPADRWRAQLDLQGLTTGDYCKGCGDRSYLAGGVHLDYVFGDGGAVGLNGGFQGLRPTFNGPASTNGFVGVEGRQFFGPLQLNGKPAI